MKIPKILVFTITYEGKDYCYDKFMSYAKELNYPNMKHIIIDNSKTEDYFNTLTERLADSPIEVYRTERGNNTREALARSQEYARRIAVKEGYDYIMSIESDLYFPPDIIQRLLSHAKEYVGALYLIGEKKDRIPCITIPEYNEELKIFGTRLLTEKGEAEGFVHSGLRIVSNCGLGCTLIKRDVFKDIMFMYYPNLKGHSDTFYSNAAYKKGFKVFCDTDILCYHDNIAWENVKDR